jgi:hypothetical protein
LLNTRLRSLIYVISPSSSLARFRENLLRLSRLIRTLSARRHEANKTSPTLGSACSRRGRSRLRWACCRRTGVCWRPGRALHALAAAPVLITSPIQSIVQYRKVIVETNDVAKPGLTSPASDPFRVSAPGPRPKARSFCSLYASRSGLMRSRSFLYRRCAASAWSGF